jgi:YbbR domain-containing protein
MLHRNLPVKAASLLLAVFLWFWVVLNEENPIIESSVEVPVAAEGIQKGFALQREPPKAVVRLRGLKEDLPSAQKIVEAFVSLRGLEPGGYDLGVQVRAPGNVAVLGVRPSEIPVVLEEIVAESRAVEVRMVGETPPGYELKGAEHTPEVVRVSGPRSRVDQASRVVVTVSVDRVVPGVATSLSARAVDSTGREVEGVALAPPHVSVMLEMQPVVVSRTLPVVARSEGTVPDGLRLVSVRIDPAMVTVVIPASRIEEITRVETEMIPLSGIQGSLTRTVRLVVPEGVNLMDAPEAKVTLKVEPIHPPAAPEEEPIVEPEEPTPD